MGDFKVNIESCKEEDILFTKEEWVKIAKEWYAKAEDLYNSVYKKIAHAYSPDMSPVVFESILYDCIFLRTNKIRVDHFLKTLNFHGLLNDQKFVDFILRYQDEMMEGVI